MTDRDGRKRIEPNIATELPGDVSFDAFEIDCPKCGSPINVPFGRMPCPACGEPIFYNPLTNQSF